MARPRRSELTARVPLRPGDDVTVRTDRGPRVGIVINVTAWRPAILLDDGRTVIHPHLDDVEYAGPRGEADGAGADPGA